jgi:hypothetical protein
MPEEILPRRGGLRMTLGGALLGTPDLPVHQPEQLIHQAVTPPVSDFNLALEAISSHDWRSLVAN